MSKENIWWSCGFIGAVLGLIYFNISTAANFFLGMGLGMCIGLTITTLLKLSGIKFNGFNSYNSNSSNRNSYDSCCDSWDD